MAPREIREDDHGTVNAYTNLGCRCDACRAVKKDADRAYRERNRERIRQTNRAYAQSHRQEIAARKLQYNERNQERNAEYQRAYSERHRERKAAYSRQYYRQNREQVLEAQREYRTRYAEILSARGRARYLRDTEYIKARARANWKLRQDEASRQATVAIGTRFQPHEDALLCRISSDTAAASALGRTVGSVMARRAKLRKKGLL